MSIYKVTQQSKATVVVTLFALAFTLSSLPGISGQTFEEHRSDLSSFVSCDIDGQIKADGNADCNAKVGSNSKVKSSVHVEYQAKTETTDAGYIITGSLSVECSVCEDGINKSELSQTVRNISEIQDYIDDQAKTLASETKRNEDMENCKIDQDGEENDRAARLECLIERMDGMEEKEARRFYDKKIKPELTELAQSTNPQDAALAASLAAKLHQQMGVNCASTVAMAQQAAAAQQANPNQAFNPMALAATSAPMAKSTPADYIKESSCDVMMMANFNGRMNQLAMQLNGPNKMAAAKAVQDLNAQWGGYFTGRGFNLQNPIMNQINMDAGSLLTQMNDFNKSFGENYDAIVKRHSDLLAQQQAAQQPSAANPNANGGDLRLLRGGGPMPENSNGGTPAVTPFPQGNGNNMGMNNGLNNGGGFTMPQRNTSAPSVLAPAFGSPVGG